MKILLLVGMLLGWWGSYRMFCWMHAPGTEFDRALPTMIVYLLTFAVTVVYVITVLWTHEFI